ncbi:MAG: cytochrome P450 [Candidatus Dormibacteraeota bacterium]|nr:cytochrome P450 [Candidatus Dormibacteraeota bacterium]
MRAAPPPGPSLPRSLQTVLWLTRPVAYPASIRHRYGAPFTLRLFESAGYAFVDAPEDVARVFELPLEVATAAEENRVLEPLLGEHSVLRVDGPEHLHLRRLLGHFLHGQAMRRHEPAIVDIVDREVAGWPRGVPARLLPRMRAITLQTILRIVFGVEPGPRGDRLRTAIEEFLALGATWMVFEALRRDLGPRSPWGRFLRLRRRIDQLLEEEMARRRASLREPGDGTVIGELIREGSLPDPVIRDQLLTLLIAGLETTATELSWAWCLLMRHPIARSLAREDAEWRQAVIRETLRVRPAFRLASRRLHRAVEIGGREVPAGWTLAALIPAVGMRSDRYPFPESFDPARWLGVRPDPHGWIPFGGGVRHCLGSALGQFEMDVVLREVLARVDLEPDREAMEPVHLHAVVMVPARGATAVVRDRVASAHAA